MKSGIWNLAFGLVAIGAAASGQFALPGTTSPTPLIVVGGLLGAFGAFQLWRAGRT